MSSNITKRYGYRFSNFGDLNHFFSEDTNRELRRARNDAAEHLEQEIKQITSEIESLEEKISILSGKLKQPFRSGIFGKIDFIKGIYYKLQLRKIKNLLEDREVLLGDAYNSFDLRLHTESQRRLQEFVEHKNAFIKTIKPLKAGAEGEFAVLNNLKNLPPNFVIINDFNVQLSRSIYDPKTKSYISSVQIDHIVIGNNGVFCIETKNWKKSSEIFYNPVKQNSRHSLILYIILKNLSGRSIPVKNVVTSNIRLRTMDTDYAEVLKHDQVAQYILFYKNQKSMITTEQIGLFKKELLSMKEEEFVYI